MFFAGAAAPRSFTDVHARCYCLRLSVIACESLRKGWDGNMFMHAGVNVSQRSPNPVGSSNRGERRFDLPGGGKRMVMPSQGVHATIVNGHVVYRDGEVKEGGPGVLLRA